MIFPADEELAGRFVHVSATEARLWGWLGERHGNESGKL
jgi:hypothetical protein